MYKRRDVTAQIVKTAEKAGFKAIVLTVDVPKLGRREADIKNKLTLSFTTLLSLSNKIVFSPFQIKCSVFSLFDY